MFTPRSSGVRNLLQRTDCVIWRKHYPLTCFYERAFLLSNFFLMPGPNSFPYVSSFCLHGPPLNGEERRTSETLAQSAFKLWLLPTVCLGNAAFVWSWIYFGALCCISVPVRATDMSYNKPLFCMREKLQYLVPTGCWQWWWSAPRNWTGRRESSGPLRRPWSLTTVRVSHLR